MHALRENLVVGTAELTVSAQLAQLNSGETVEQEKIRHADRTEEKIKIESTARVQTELTEEIAYGLAHFDEMDDVARATYVREFVTTDSARLMAGLEKVDHAELTESVIRAKAKLATAFGQFIYHKVRLAKRLKD